MKRKPVMHPTSVHTAPIAHRVRHESVPTLNPDVEGDAMPDQPFAFGREDELDADLRYRLVSEAAYHRLAERGYSDGSEIDDWGEAAADVDHTLINRGTRG
ncbi:MAG TPA: DUF2934 domain-containing protein [Casimicrobiaceae bacterium]|nr:DUF2934 domain-containing protein [Casimicrobiaceae bacterium]